ncbi:MAG: 1-phosphofructokinase [Coprobacillaceae bacterium]
MIYTVTMNPSLDYISHVKEFQLGEVNRNYKEDMFPGGKGINVSTILCNLNQETIAVGFLAGFTGLEIENKLKEKGIQTKFVYVDKGISRINVKIKSQEETELNGMGPIIDEKAISQLLSYLTSLKKDDILVLAGSIPNSLPTNMYQQIMTKIKDKNVRVIVDATDEVLLSTLECKPFLIKPNIKELEEIMKKTLCTKEEIIEAAQHLQSLGAKNVLISCGKDGAILVCESKEVYHQNAPKGSAVNSTGAGDSMVAGFVYGYTKNHNYLEGLQWGVACGSATAFTLDLATKEQIYKVYHEVCI